MSGSGVWNIQLVMPSLFSSVYRGAVNSINRLRSRAAKASRTSWLTARVSLTAVILLISRASKIVNSFCAPVTDSTAKACELRAKL